MTEQDFYNSIADSYDELYFTEQIQKITAIISALGKDIPKKNDFLLDIGCGTGISTAVWNAKSTGIDPSSELVKIAKKNYKKSNFVIGSAEFLPFENKIFDVVCAITSMHNFNDIRKAIDEIKRVGKSLFIFSILKKSSKLEMIEKLIILNFRIKKIVMEEKDVIFICKLV